MSRPVGRKRCRIGSPHVRAFAFFGGVPGMIVSDNLKAGVIKACFYNPEINRTYGDMATHYGTAVVPAGRISQRQGQGRERRPTGRALDLAKLRNQTFFGLDELNAAIRPLRDALNGKVTRHLAQAASFVRDHRQTRAEAVARCALRLRRMEAAPRRDRLSCRVDRHYYSVPHPLTKQKLWVVSRRELWNLP